MGINSPTISDLLESLYLRFATVRGREQAIWMQAV